MQVTEYQDIADLMTGTKVTVFVKNRCRGIAYPGDTKVVVPAWIQSRPTEYQYYYVIHEVCHILVNTHLHSRQFKAVECYWLAEFGIVPIYGKSGRRAYPTQLKSAAGPTLFDSGRE